MSEADKMFEDLGYMIDENETRVIYDNRDTCIIFDFETKTIEIDETISICIKLLQAINKKCKELDWI
jgi:hypothetical protein